MMEKVINIAVSCLIATVIILMTCVRYFRILYEERKTSPARPERFLSTVGIAVSVIMTTGITYGSIVWDLTYPGVQLPVHFRIVYTYWLSALAIVSVGYWIFESRSK